MNDSFARRFVIARKKSNMTQMEVAEKLDISFEEVSLWERGENLPGMDKMSEIAKLFGVTIDWLMTGEYEIEDTFYELDSLSDRLFNEDKMYTYVKTYATMKGMTQTLRVLPYARDLHKNQYRKGKDKIPYIYHPLLLCCHALALGLEEDDLISTALLHDVCEDCGILPSELPVNEETRKAVDLLTRKKSSNGDASNDFEAYYAGIIGNKIATIVKLLDRCNNISGMATGFSKEKMIRYIEETETFIYPIMRKARAIYPVYSNQIFLIKYHMMSVMESLKRQLIQKFD